MIKTSLKALCITFIAAQVPGYYNGANDAVRARMAAMDHNSDFETEYNKIVHKASRAQNVINEVGKYGYAFGYNAGIKAPAPDMPS